MAEPFSEVLLPPSVESMLQKICTEQCQSPPDTSVRKQLELLGEEVSLEILGKISTQKIYKTLSGFIMHLAKNYARAPTQQGIYQSPHKRSSDDCYSPVNSPNGVGSHSQVSKRLVFSPSSEGASTQKLSPHLLALSELEFRKGFLILSYIGSNKLEDFMLAHDISNLKNLPMRSFEAKVYDYGEQNKLCSDKDRPKYLDWDSGKTHMYYCHVFQDESYTFKGPDLNSTRTHLQRELGDQNVLIVKFVEEATSCNNWVTGSSNYDVAFNKIAEEGILVGLRRFRFFVFKDGGKVEKKKSPTSSAVKCYFVRMESLAPCDETESYILSKKTVHEARCLFMDVQMVSSLAKYMARFSLILSKTIKLQVDLASITIEEIKDISCRDENECVVRDEDREPLIHTDGTGYISEDIALKTPKDFSRAKFINDENFERFLDHANCEEKSLELRGSEAHTREPPLLMQIRLFHNGRAFKGTLLVNRKLPEKTIHVRSSMRKVPEKTIQVEADSRLSNMQTFNSLEIVGISESFYLMGTADPTEELNSDEVCVILENGQISGQVLVYRNPGLHFGDIHVLKAVYVKALEDFVGNAKYAIFFSIKGRRSVGSEIANGDFDGDMYWVSRNPEVVIPDEIKAEKFPHYLEKPNKYHSTSVLGLIYERVESFQSQDLSATDVEVWKLPCFDVEIPTPYMKLWHERYSEYRREMSEAMKLDDELKNNAANAVTKRYKQLLYGAAVFEESPRNSEDIYNEALAIYNVTYDYAKRNRDVKKCGFAWKVAGSALFKLHVIKQSEKTENPIVCSPSVLREVLN
ncbi:putative RNA-dependent RNA polymerase 3 [Camellia lanceoleosa]|uniref:RNA-dependent RNA polymerase 3 n=1 Tax=Camellia lanceoleosa TaxID=1840588 RepID=A0ACC0I7L6_9ERIC|nr:putative RNA-dependent RNA polymerase 3 [Camellia lanceoleosa]